MIIKKIIFKIYSLRVSLRLSELIKYHTLYVISNKSSFIYSISNKSSSLFISFILSDKSFPSLSSYLSTTLKSLISNSIFLVLLNQNIQSYYAIIFFIFIDYFLYKEFK